MALVSKPHRICDICGDDADGRLTFVEYTHLNYEEMTHRSVSLACDVCVVHAHMIHKRGGVNTYRKLEELNARIEGLRPEMLAMTIEGFIDEQEKAALQRLSDRTRSSWGRSL